MKIILVRHAKAEHVYGKYDRERDLTPEGIRRFKPKAQDLAERLSTDNKVVHVWSSPANRAKQTADIIVETLNNETVCSLEEAIYYGDFDELLIKMNDLDFDDTVIIVGHQPNMSYWSGYLCGYSLSYQTGDIAGFKVNSLDPLSADLLWNIT